MRRSALDLGGILMARAFTCDACRKTFAGTPATAETAAGSIGAPVLPSDPAAIGTPLESTGRRELCSVECGITLFARLTANPVLARATLEAALKLGRVTAIPSATGSEKRRRG